MFHLKSFLYGEVQVDTWADYSVSDRAAIRQQMQLHGHGSQSETTTTDVSKVCLTARLWGLFVGIQICSFQFVKPFLKIKSDLSVIILFLSGS